MAKKKVPTRQNHPRTYKPPENPGSPFGLNRQVPVGYGYDANVNANLPDASQLGASGFLSFTRPDHTLALLYIWVEDVTVDFSLSGQTGQSPYTREFFPRSLNDVTVTISGRVANTTQFNLLGKFVREHQVAVVSQQASTSSKQLTDHLVRFYLDDRTPSAFRGAKRSSKGGHRPWDIRGYIKEAAGGARRHEVAPQFTLGLVVAESTLSPSTGIWAEAGPSNGQALADIDSLVKHNMKHPGFVSRQGDPQPSVQKTVQNVGNEIAQGLETFASLAAKLFS